MLFQITPSAIPEGYGEALLPIDDAKAWLRVFDDEQDLLIAALRDAALDAVEQYCGVYLGPRTGMVASFAGFGTGMRVGRGPAAGLAVTAVSYVDSAGVAVEMVAPEEGVAGDWRVAVGGSLVPAIGACWPVSYGPVTVTFDAGFAAGTAPPGLITAAKMFMATLFSNRETVVTGATVEELPLGFKMLCDQHRMPVI